MRAVVFYQHGGPEVLAYREDIPVPQPGPGEVLVAVKYAALNRLDDFVRTGWRGLDLTFPHILGADFSGTIAALGAEVSGWGEGQRVVANPTLWCGKCPQCLAGWHNRCDSFAILGEHVPGAYAEFVRVPARNLVAIPDGFPDDLDLASAAAPLVCVTAWHMLITAGHVRAGETVLVVGAGGGVNSVAIQIAKLAGATVLVIAADAEKAAKARALGADLAIDRTAEPNWSKAVYAATGRRGVDVVVDNVGAATWSISLRCLAQGRPAAHRRRDDRLRGGHAGQSDVRQTSEHHREHDGHAGRFRGGDGAGVGGTHQTGRGSGLPVGRVSRSLGAHDGRGGVREDFGAGRMMDAERNVRRCDKSRARASASGNSPARPRADARLSVAARR